ncbi:hypothetical protein BHE74_00010185 [Ensete ventricosum]|uniref:Proteasome alpha-type subunits domain-containing protein n=1 Tax=Ensete ventricosum TaxID=4639 RepID=A0A427AUX6_ENSVE|nr:hypothetical protein B296_00011416 [Ensete ventricosum]RWW81410.1 hypothetical protein BHE74_00010185 [Ensete ventricosum]
MFRNQYDTDVTTWSPAGRLFQVEYAMEAVKQGAAAVGLRSTSHVVLATVNKAASDLSSHQRKVFKIDDHIGVAIAGLTADGRVLSRYLRNECINHSFVYESPLPVSRLVVHLADKAQVPLSRSPFPLLFPFHRPFENPTQFTIHELFATSLGFSKRCIPERKPFSVYFNFRLLLQSISIVCTQRSWKRPYGVGLLVAGLDETGAHLYYNCPSGNYFEYQAFAIGSRSQAAKTFMERRFDAFNSYSRDELIKDALFAIKETLQGEKLTSSICTVAVVGIGEPFHMLDQKIIQEVIDSIEIKEDDAAAADQAPIQDEDKSSEAAPMDI